MPNILFYALLIITSSNGCLPLPRHGNAAVIPTGFNKKNQASVSGSYGLYGLSTSVAYSPFNHFFIQGAWTYYKTPEYDDRFFQRTFFIAPGVLIPEFIIRLSFHFSVWLIERFSNVKVMKSKWLT